LRFRPGERARERRSPACGPRPAVSQCAQDGRGPTESWPPGPRRQAATERQDMRPTGPVELVLIVSPQSVLRGEVIAELARLADAGTIDVLDALVVRKADDGRVEWLEVGESGDDELARVVGEPAGLLAAEDVDDIADELAPGSAVGMLVFEHTWARGLASAV